MVEDVFGLGKGFDLLRGILDLVKDICKKRGKKKSAEKDARSEFLEAALTAMRQTLSYLGRVPYTRDDMKEAELSALWDKVALTAEPFNKDLAHRCYLKSSYWAYPERWTDAQLDAAKIEIGLMEKEIGKLFNGNDRRRKGK